MLSLSSSERPRCERTRYADSNASSSAADESPPGTAAYCERPEPWSARAGLARRIRYASPAPARHMKHSSEPTTATPASAVADSDEGRSAGFVPRAVGRGDPIGRAVGAGVGAAVGALVTVGVGVGIDVGAPLGRGVLVGEVDNDGVGVGAGVGAALGAGVGAALGAEEGAGVGLLDGRGLGADVGDGDGTLVGAALGPGLAWS